MWKPTTPAAWAQHRTPAEWADHHLKVVVLLIGIGVFASYPFGMFVLAAATAAIHARAAPSSPPAAKPISGFGLVVAMNDSMGTITIQQTGIPEIDLQPGTTGFRASPGILKRTEVGDQLNFRLSKEGEVYVITAVHNPTLGDGIIPG
jgi:hypothetical protein